jgi:hypothetical protein
VSAAAWRQSPLFKKRLFGPKEAVREAWGMQNHAADFWHTYLLKAPLAKVQAHFRLPLAHQPLGRDDQNPAHPAAQLEFAQDQTGSLLPVILNENAAASR